ncbi:uncharacterized protein MONOS_5084 [Monocercomonoides exilis]|uniref:uncharacterized protein n=1 Tax=Monocercomonoides exilis TaxID=2049356 RepID=UPI0035597BE0|nr:hypothetical protein MONOS_5084 [Monocercomonoides exilis]|eukprot:MONOS_5084.1-p1 / transcript=MONOS_5084.1 / gene=MONOS_5084 / organism=Monocercomonoides_exilis_PA203 / gene_product=unspecified product / transcript_product=unspecified product / location=Mono_scaffold00144:51854-52126(-) / protein_length=91 / sequence_SO=supercontig / SO=protein_coding / is_pseudo=false
MRCPFTSFTPLSTDGARKTFEVLKQSVIRLWGRGKRFNCTFSEAAECIDGDDNEEKNNKNGGGDCGEEEDDEWNTMKQKTTISKREEDEE